MIDEVDKAILTHLQQNGRMALNELAGHAQLSPTGAQKRLQKLEDNGIIQNYTARVSREKVGYDLMCFIQVSLHRHERQVVHQFRQAVQDMPQVLECHLLTGDTDYLLKVIARNQKDLEHFLIDILTPAPGVDKIRTSMVLSEVKNSNIIPFDVASA